MRFYAEILVCISADSVGEAIEIADQLSDSLLSVGAVESSVVSTVDDAEHVIADDEDES